MASGEDRTEPATPKRRLEARKRGQVAKSMDLSSMFVLFGMLLALHSLLGSTGEIIKTYFQSSFRPLEHPQLSNSLVPRLGLGVFTTLIRAAGPFMLLAMILAVVINTTQTGWLIASQRLKPDFNRLNPLNGAKRFISPGGLVELVKSLCKIGVVGSICFFTLRGSYTQLLLLTHFDVVQGVGVILDIAYRMAIRVVLTMLIIGVLDYGFQRYTMEKSMRMTKDEVKQEFKQSEGNPRIKSRIRARQRQIAKKRMMAEVPNADVVVTNPTHFAIALKYDPTRMGAPFVVAKGQDLLAMKIRELAQQSDVPIVENPPLARALYHQTPLGSEIPAHLYEAVAEVIAYVYQINEKRRQRQGWRMN